MKKFTKKFTIEKTKKGFPALWESGGGYRNTGYARIIAGKCGEEKKPIYLKTRGHLANAEHALFVIEVGDLIIEADHHREDFNIEIFRVVEISDDYCVGEKINDFSMGEWDHEPTGKVVDAIDAAKGKATDYHCRSPWYYTY